MAAVNNIVRTVKPGRVIEDASAVIDSTVSINQGDLVVLDETNHLLKLPSAESEASTFLGVSNVTIVSGKLQSPYTGTAVDAAQAASAVPGPQHGVVCKLTLKSGDALVAGGLVYLDPSSGTQHVQAAGSKAIGVYQGAAITGDGSKKVEVLLGHRFPGDTLVI